MKKKPTNTQTRSTLAQSNDRAGNDTNQMKKFEVILGFTQYSKATVIIEAATLEEAEEKADELGADEIDDWNPFDGEVFVHSVEPKTEEGKADHD
jgi:hypothetical protein